MKASEAFSKGAVDLVIKVPKELSGQKEIDFLEEKAIGYVKEHWNDDLETRIVSRRPFESLGSFFYSQIEKKITKSSRGMVGPITTFNLLKDSAGLSFEEGMDLEQKALANLIRSPQSAALQHLFFSERSTSKINVAKNTKPLKINSVGIIGAGTMGSGIVINFVKSGIKVVLLEMKESYLEKGIANIQSILSKKVKKDNKFAVKRVKQQMGLIKTTTKYEDLSEVDLVIEAVFEDMKVKKSVLSKLDQVCKKDAILCTNTSTLDVDEIASATSRPEKVIGMHFFAPANVMKLLENVRGEKTSDETILTVMTLSKILRKIPVLVGNCYGFVANRILLPYIQQAFSLVLEGALPEQVDKAMYKFGFPMGPFAVCDLSGVDIIKHILQSAAMAAEKGIKGAYEFKNAKKDVFTVANKLFDMKRLGIKTGKGFYLYKKGSNKPIVDENVTKMILEASKAQGIKRREISDEEIVERCIFAAVNEGFRCLEDKTAEKPSDIDIVWIFGMGFPPYLGGLMYHSDVVGLPNVLKKIKSFHEKEPGNPYWKPSALLEKLVQTGESVERFFARARKAKL